ncbi:MAG: alanine racemase [Clostridia bacterium]|nr:alanine racemase [Clostridia bacterium]
MNLNRAMSRAWAEVDEDALLHNYRLARSLCGEGVRFICVVKANAYGLGLDRTVRTLHEAGADWFSVAAPEEALIVRRALPDASILLMSPAEESYLPTLIQKNISLTVGTVEDARKASEAAARAGRNARVHIKLDTGLHRLGFTDADEALRVKDLPSLTFEAIYSHMALRGGNQSVEQEALFTALADAIEAGGLRVPMRHLLDSIGLTRYPQWQMQGVRVGAFLYGNIPPAWDRYPEGKNVVAFKSRVTRVAWARKGDGVGYDDTPLERDTLVATLPVGYIDGYPRVLSHVAQVSVNGRRAPVLGLICMDQMMIDVTDIPSVRQGDVVTLLGGDISLREYAAWGHLNRNECLGILGRRVPRIYLRGGQPVRIEAEMDAEPDGNA